MKLFYLFNDCLPFMSNQSYTDYTLISNLRCFNTKDKQLYTEYPLKRSSLNILGDDCHYIPVYEKEVLFAIITKTFPSEIFKREAILKLKSKLERLTEKQT